MNYVEWLRVRNTLRVLAIVLGAFILIVLVLRISFNQYITEDNAFIKHIKLEPGATVSQSVLPDGTKRTTIKSPSDNTTVVIDNHGINGRHIVITEPLSKAHEHEHRAVIGSVVYNERNVGKMAVTTIDTNGSVPFLYYMAIADLAAFFIATVLAAPFARESDGHLEYALTKPVSRETFAVSVIGADLAGIIAASLMTIVALLLCQAMFEVPSFDFGGVNTSAILMGIAAPFAWYGLLAASTASLKRGYGAILGFAWPVAILVVVFAEIPWGDSLVGQLVHNVFWTISRIDPLSYISFTVDENSAGQLTGPPNFAPRLAIEFALFLIYSTLAVVQWRRVEA
ncbi:MAG: hypothetical protein JO322_06320 [Candidatus Eremiobacteraeota bacterium]|nr:hypothetical protein [Candidatus Eremiobacteraeota bacterium]